MPHRLGVAATQARTARSGGRHETPRRILRPDLEPRSQQFTEIASSVIAEVGRTAPAHDKLQVNVNALHVLPGRNGLR